MSGLHFHPLRVRQVQPDGDDAMLVSFDVPEALRAQFSFVPGQYLTLRQGEWRRSYSICAAPGDVLRVGVRRVPGGAFSSWLHGALKAGDALDVMEPQGRFGAALAQRPRRVLALAGGSGITPILSIVKTVLAQDADARVLLLYGNRSVASMMFKEELEDLKNKYLVRLMLQPVFSREGGDSALNSGRLDRDKIETGLRLAGWAGDAVQGARVDQAFVCGPHAMNDELEAALRGVGLAPERIHIERFGVPPGEITSHEPRAGDAEAARIVIVRDGVQREIGFNTGDGSILAAAARAGLDVPYSCRSGVCATCRAKVLEGQVRMDRNFALEPDELAAGFVLSCQAHPLTERVVLSFDHR